MFHLLAPALLALAPAPDITGVFEVDGAPADVRLVLHERAGGKIIGYVAGSPGIWITSGQLYGEAAMIHLHGEDGGSDEGWDGTLRLYPVGSHYKGVFYLDDDDEVLIITLTPSKEHFFEETWTWRDEESETFVDVRRLLDPGDNFLGGGFSGQSSCVFMACGGTIDTWDESSVSHTITTSSTGDCGQTGTLHGTFDSATNQLDGPWVSTDCNNNPSGGNFHGGKAGYTTCKHIRAMLLSLGAFADDFEAESLNAADVFHSAYLSDGTTRADWEAQFTAWYAAYDEIEVETTNIANLIYVVGSDVHPYLLDDPRLVWTVRASGLNVSTGVVETFWEREEPQLLGPELSYVGAEGGRLVFVGNGETQLLTIGLPILLSDVVYDTFGATTFGLHGGGHPDDGHGGIDWEYQAGAFVYAAEAGKIINITPNTGHPPLVQWDVLQEIRPGIHLQYGHIADPPTVNIGDDIATGDVIGSPSMMPGDSHYTIHYALRASNVDLCPIPFFNASAQSDWDIIWPQCHTSSEICEPFECNDREAEPPHTATWELEIAGTASGPDSIYVYRKDGTVYEPDYTFFDAAGAPYETGDIEWENSSSPTTLGLRFVDVATGAITFGACDIINDEMHLKLDPTAMPTDMSGAAIYRYEQ